MEKLSAIIDELVSYARANLGLAKENETAARNAVLDVLGSPSYSFTGAVSREKRPDGLLERLERECVASGIFSAGEA